MPIYEYACTACQHKLEVLQKMSDEHLVQCPACQQDTLKRLVSAAGFRLKGTGWYETDFKGKKKVEPEKDVSDSPKSTKSEPSTTETKTTTPKETHTTSAT